MIPQGIQNIIARKTVGVCKQCDIGQKGMIHTTIQDDSRASVGWVRANTGGTQTDRGEEDSKVHILRDLTITPHEASVHILAVGKCRLAGDQVLETSDDLTTVVEDSVGDGSGINGEEHAVDERIGGGEVSWGVSLVTGLVEHSILVDNFQDLVTTTGVVPNMVIVDRDVGGVPGVGVPNCEDHRGGDERAEEIIEDTVEGVDQGVSSNSKLVPIPGG